MINKKLTSKKRLRVDRIVFVIIILCCIILAMLYFIKHINKSKMPDYLKQSSQPSQKIGVTESIIEKTDEGYIGIHYPITDKERIDKFIKEKVLSILSDFNNEVQNNVKVNGKTKYVPELYIDYESYMLNDKYCSIVLDICENLGYYVHPDQRRITYNFRLDTEELQNIGDIGKGRYLHELSKICSEEIKKDSNYAENKENSKLIVEPKEENFNNFILKKDGLSIVFEKYKYLPGASGNPEVIIPYEKLKGYLKSEVKREDTEKQKIETSVIQKPQRNIDSNKPMIAITFDDGPHPTYTNSILESLTEYNGVATFFVLGNRVSSYGETVKKVIEQGSEIGNHSWNHRQLTNISLEDLQSQIDDTQENVFYITGQYPIGLRPPYGSINSTLRENANMPFILWNIDTEDWKSRDTEQIIQRALDNVKDGDIILMHDIYQATANAVPIILQELDKQGYQFVTITELFEQKGINLENGKAYTDAR